MNEWDKWRSWSTWWPPMRPGDLEKVLRDEVSWRALPGFTFRAAMRFLPTAVFTYVVVVVLVNLLGSR